jgi:hypothetical protein
VTRWRWPRWLLLATTVATTVTTVVVALSRIVAANAAGHGATRTSYEPGAALAVGAAAAITACALIGFYNSYKHSAPSALRRKSEPSDPVAPVNRFLNLEERPRRSERSFGRGDDARTHENGLQGAHRGVTRSAHDFQRPGDSLICDSQPHPLKLGRTSRSASTSSRPAFERSERTSRACPVGPRTVRKPEKSGLVDPNPP